MLSIRRTFSAIAFGAVALVAAPAHANVITGTGDDFSIGWLQTQGTNTLKALATFDITSFSASTIVMQISISNLSTLTTFSNAGINSFGLVTAPTVAVSMTTPGTVFDGASNDSVPGNTAINFCVFASNNCAGGAQPQLLAVGASDIFTVTLTGDFSNGLNITDNRIKFQTSGGSFEFPGGFCTNPEDPNCFDRNVPEPGTLLLLSLGALAGFASTRRRAA